MDVVKLIRPEPLVVRLVRQPGGAIQLIRPSHPPVQLVTNRAPVIFVNNASELNAVSLAVVSNGQTVWDLGLSEHRRTLWINGVRYFLNQHYTIQNGILTWTDSLVIKSFFNLQLT